MTANLEILHETSPYSPSHLTTITHKRNWNRSKTFVTEAVKGSFGEALKYAMSLPDVRTQKNWDFPSCPKSWKPWLPFKVEE